MKVINNTFFCWQRFCQILAMLLLLLITSSAFADLQSVKNTQVITNKTNLTSKNNQIEMQARSTKNTRQSTKLKVQLTVKKKEQTVTTQKNIVNMITLPAQVIAYQQATIYAKVAGYLINITVDKGDKVKKAQLIADIEVPELNADREQFQAEAEVAERIYGRLRIAMKKAPDLVVPQTVDEAYGRWKVAQAKLVRTEMLLSYARIVAPFSGTITARFVDPGAFIPLAVNGKGNGGAVVTLMDLDHIRIQAYVPAEYASRVVSGCPVEIISNDSPGFILHDKITRISYALDPLTQTMLAEVDRNNKNAMFHPNMFLTMKIFLCSNQKEALAQQFFEVIPSLSQLLWGGIG